MDDTQVDWTKRIDTSPPAPPQPGDSAAPNTPPATERLQHLEHQVKIGRVLLGVCAGVLALLIVAVVALSAGLFARLDAVVTSVTTLEQRVSSTSAGEGLGNTGASDTGSADADATGGLGFLGALGGASNAGASSDGAQATDDSAQAADGEAQATDDSEQADPLRASDLTAIVNKKWSNALRILESYGVDQSDLTLVTDDGGAVFDPGNWTVTMVVDLDEPGQVAVYLRHDIDWPW